MAWQAPQQHSQQQQQQQPQPQQDLASHFHLLPLIESVADAMERGAVDQHVNELVNDLAARFERCQQLLNNVTSTANSKPMTLRSQKQKLEEYENQLNLRSDLLLKYKSMVEQAVNPDQYHLPALSHLKGAEGVLLQQ